eukprot:GILK01009489.1.p1 GENE.GILK01009489.1~~GILK01009489.1.p1  ORF type:complete len:1606 (+),score=408.10 GILK01009489.1:66-4820(+)
MTASIRTLNRVASKGGKRAATAIGPAGVRQLVQSLQKHAKFKQLVEYTMSCLATLCENENLVEAIVECGGVEAILEALKLHGDNAQVRTLAMKALGILAESSEEIGSLIAKFGGIEALMQHVKTSTDVLVLKTGLQSLASLALVEDNVAKIVQQGGLEAAIATIKSHCHSQEVLKAGLFALNRLMVSEEIASLIVQKGGLEAIIMGLKAYPHFAAEAESALFLLESLSLLPENVNLISALGGVDAILGVMTANPRHAGILETGARLLQALNGELLLSTCISKILSTTTSASELTKAISDLANLLLMDLTTEQIQQLLESGVLKRLDAVGSQYASDESIQQALVRFVEVLAGKSEAARSALTESVLVQNIISNIFGSHPELLQNDLIVSSAFKAIQLCLMSDEESVHQAVAVSLKAVQAVETILDLIQLNIKNESLVHAAMGLLAQLSEDPTVCEQIVGSGGVEMLIQVLKQHGDNAFIPLDTFLTMGNLACTESGMAALESGQNLQEILKIIKRVPPANEMATIAALNLLNRISSNVSDETILTSVGGLAFVMQTVKNGLNGPLNGDIMRQALSVLETLSLDPTNVAVIIESNGVDMLLKVLEEYTFDEDVVMLAAQILPRLVRDDRIAAKVLASPGLAKLMPVLASEYANPALLTAGIELIQTLGQWADVPTLMQVAAVTMLNQVMQAHPELLAELHLKMTGVKPMMSVFTLLETLQTSGLAVLQDPEVKSAVTQAIQLIQSLSSTVEPLTELQQQELTCALRCVEILTLSKDSMAVLLDHHILNSLVSLMSLNQVQPESTRVAAVIVERLSAVHEAVDEMAASGAGSRLVNMIRELKVKPIILDQLRPMIQTIGNAAVQLSKLDALARGAVISSLIHALSANMSDEKLITVTARALRKLANSDQALAEMADEGAIQLLIQALLQFPSSLELLKEGVFLLGTLAMNDALKHIVAQNGGVRVIIDIMKRFPNESSLVENCCFALANLAFNNEQNMSEIVNAGGINATIDALLTHPMEFGLLENASCLLSNLCFRSEINKAMIGRMGGCKAVLDIVNLHYADTRHPAMLLNALRCLGNLALYMQNVTLLIKEGVMKAIGALLETKGHTDDVLQIALGVIGNLAAEEAQGNLEDLARDGAIQLVIQTMNSFPFHSSILMNAIDALNNLAMNESNAACIIAEGGLEGTLSAMQAHDWDQELIERSLKFIGYMAMYREAVTRFTDQGGIQVVVSAVRSHIDSPEIVTQACRALARMSSDEKVCRLMGTAGVIESTLAAAEEHLSDVAVVGDCFHLLANLTTVEDNSTVIAVKGVAFVVQAIRSHIFHPQFLKGALILLGHLAFLPSNAEIILQDAGAEAVIDCMRAQPRNVKLLNQAIRTLMNVAMINEEFCQVLLFKKADTYILAIVNDPLNAAHPNLLEEANMALATLGKGHLASLPPPPPVIETFVPLPAVTVMDTSLSKEIRNLLLAGRVFKMHSAKDSSIKSKHVSLSQDLNCIIWRHAGQAHKPQNSLMVRQVREIRKGLGTPALQRKRMFAAGPKPECCFSIIGPTTVQGQQTLDLECPSAEECDKFVLALEQLVTYIKRR